MTRLWIFLLVAAGATGCSSGLMAYGRALRDSPALKKEAALAIADSYKIGCTTLEAFLWDWAPPNKHGHPRVFRMPGSNRYGIADQQSFKGAMGTTVTSWIAHEDWSGSEQHRDWALTFENGILTSIFQP